MEYPILSGCEDYKKLFNSLSGDILKKFEEILQERRDFFEKYYMINMELDEIIGKYEDKFGCPFIVDWYVGSLDTDSLIDTYKGSE